MTVTAEASRAREQPDAGSATVWVVAGVGLLVAATAAVAGVAATTVTRHRAQTSADAAALAAALHTVDGQAAACAEAGEAVAADGGHLETCEITGPYVRVAVSAALPGRLAVFGPVVAHARAGPAGRL